MDKWINHLEKMRRKMQHYNEKEMPKYITFFYYYISSDNTIEKIKKQKYAAAAPTKITSGELLRTICEKRNTGYYLDELLLFQQEKMTPLPLTTEDVELKPSLFIYHDVNCIFFIFRQRAGANSAAKTRRTMPYRQQKKYTRKR